MARLTDEQKAEAPRNLANLWGFDVDKIHVEPGFNVRAEGPELDAHIRWLADEMKRVGFDHTQPLAVIRHPDLRNHAIIRKGHCRFRGVLLAISEGADIQTVPCLIEPKGTNAILQTYQLGTSNSGRGLGYLEYATAIMRLKAWGEKDEQIIAGFGGAEAGKSQGWLNAVLDLNGASPEIHQIVKSGRMADTPAVRIVRQHGSKAVEVATAAVAHAAARGKTKATGQDIKAVERADPPRTIRESLATLACRAVLAWRASMERNADAYAMDEAMEALEAVLGEAAIDAAREKQEREAA